MKTITAAEFEATCPDLLDRFASGTLDGVAITKHGRVVAVLRPPKPPVTSESVFGHMRGTAFMPRYLDLTAPLAPHFDKA